MPHQTAGSTITLAVTVVKTLILLLGGLVAYFAYKAYARTGNPSLGYLAGGFGLVVIGSILGGLVHELIGVSLAAGVLLEGLFVAAGFAMIAYSLRG